MTLSQLIISYRNEHNISQRQMAAQCRLSTGYISLIEKETNPQTGKRMVPTLTVLNKLAKGMGMTIDNLLTACDDMPVDISVSGKAPAPVAEDGRLSELIELASQLPENQLEMLIAQIKGLLAAAKSDPAAEVEAAETNQ